MVTAQSNPQWPPFVYLSPSHGTQIHVDQWGRLEVKAMPRLNACCWSHRRSGVLLCVSSCIIPTKLITETSFPFVCFACSPEEFCEYFFRVCLGILHWKMAGIFGESFLVSVSHNEAWKILEKFGENPEQNSGQNSGRKFEKFGKLSFCDFPDLTFVNKTLPNYRRYKKCHGNKCQFPGN